MELTFNAFVWNSSWSLDVWQKLENWIVPFQWSWSWSWSWSVRYSGPKNYLCSFPVTLVMIRSCHRCLLSQLQNHNLHRHYHFVWHLVSIFFGNCNFFIFCLCWITIQLQNHNLHRNYHFMTVAIFFGNCNFCMFLCKIGFVSAELPLFTERQLPYRMNICCAINSSSTITHFLYSVKTPGVFRLYKKPIAGKLIWAQKRERDNPFSPEIL